MAKAVAKTLLIASVVYAIAGVAVHHFELPEAILEYIAPRFAFGGFVFVVAMITVFCLQLRKSRKLNRTHALLGIIIFLSYDCCFRIVIPPQSHECVLRAILLISAVILIFLSRKKKGKQVASYVEMKPCDLGNEPIKKILEWANDDRPIENSSQDYFGFFPIAKRIFFEIKKKLENGENFVVGLLGHFGAGKSSVASLVRQELMNHDYKKTKILFTAISCWGFEKSETALREILERVIEEMEDLGIDTGEIHRIPEQYIHALKKTSTFAEQFLEIFVRSRDRTPKSVLSNLESLLLDNDLRLVLVIEDFDRNEHESFDMAEFTASLMFLRSVRNVSLIISGRPYTRDSYIDYLKLCDRIESIPSVDAQSITTIFEKIAEYHTGQMFSDDVPLTRLHFNDLADGDYDQSFLDSIGIHNIVEYSTHGWQSLLKICLQPRSIKSSIRDLHAAWQRLHGECDYVELLFMTVLRNGHHRIYSFIGENIMLFRNPSVPNTIILNDRISKLADEIGEETDSLKKIFTMLFPKAAEALQQRRPLFQPTSKSRRIFNTYPIDYYDRIVSEMIFQDKSDLDQILLRAITSWNEKRTPELVDLLADANFKNEALRSRWLACLDAGSILDLTDQVVMKIFNDATFHKKKLMGIEPGMKILHYQWYSYRTAQYIQEFPGWFERFFRTFLPQSMLFASEFYHCFGVTTEYINENGIVIYWGMHPQGPFEETRNLFIECARQAYSTPELVAQACFGEQITSEESDALYKLFYATSPRQSNPISAPTLEYSRSSDWCWMAEILIAGLESDEQALKTKIYALTEHLLLDLRRLRIPPSDEDLSPNSYYLTHFAEHAFSANQLRRLMELLSSGANPFGGYSLHNINAVSGFAQNWLIEHNQE